MNNINVLIVDDSELDRYILRRQLTALGVQNIEEKDDGSSALAYFCLLYTSPSPRDS